MLDHITLGVADFARARAFYDAVLAPLGVTRLVTLDPSETESVPVVGYGARRPQFWLAGERPVAGLMHLAFEAQTHSAVDAFYAAALAAGGTCNGPPGLRAQYHPAYYAAFIHDPEGHNVEAVCHAAPT